MAMVDNNMFDTLQQEISTRDKVPGINQIDILNLPPPLDSTFNKITRQGRLTLSEFANELHLAQAQGEFLAKLLVEKGYLRTVQGDHEVSYKIKFARTRKRKVSSNIWDTLDL